jgi:hypothetical protein
VTTAFFGCASLNKKFSFSREIKPRMLGSIYIGTSFEEVNGARVT